MQRRLDHKFRFQLLAKWISQHYNPCKMADVGGGKGLLSLILGKYGFESTVIDPCNTDLITKFKDIETGKRVLVKPDEAKAIKRKRARFEKEMGRETDLLVGLHAHGCNMLIIDAASEYGKSFVLLPCCVIDEPIEVKPDIDWFKSLVEYAKSKGLKAETDEINFKGQNKIIFVR